MSQSERRKATSDDIILELEDAYTKNPGKNVGPLAEAYIDYGRPKDAIRVLEKDGNGQVDTQVLLAKALYDSFQNAKAAETIKAAVQKGNLEKNLRAQLLLGEMAYEENREDEAKKHLKVAYGIDSNNLRAAQLLNTLGEEVSIPEVEEDDEDDLRGFNTEEEQQEHLGKALGQILLGIIVCGALFFAYYVSAQRAHEAKMLAVDAIPMLEKGDVESLLDAEKNYDKILELEADNRYALAGKAYLHALLWVEHGMDTSRPDAVDYAEQAAMEDIMSAERFAAEVLTAIGNQDYAKATRIAEDVASGGGISDKLQFSLGLALERQGKTRLARENFRKAHDVKASAPHYSAHLGNAYDADGDRGNASLYWAKSAQANSNFVPGATRDLIARIRKGETELKVEETLKRLEGFGNELLGKTDKAAIAITRAALAWREGRGEAAVKAADEAIAIGGSSAFRLYYKGLGHLAVAQTEEGFKALKGAMDAEPASKRYLGALVKAYTEGGKVDEAIKVLQAQPKKDQAEAAYHVQLGDAYRAKKDFENAKKSYDKALELRKEYADALLGMAVLYWNQKKNDDAIKWFEKAASARSKFPQVYENIGMMFISMGATTDGNIQLEEAERQYMAKQVGKVELARFYKLCAETLTPRSWSLGTKWKAKLDALLAPPPAPAAPAATPK